MADIDLHNESDYDFEDISSEKRRHYEFAEPGGDTYQERFVITIEDPQWLSVSDSGHRILDGDERSHFIPFGWKHLQWEPEEGEPHFVK